MFVNSVDTKLYLGIDRDMRQRLQDTVRTMDLHARPCRVHTTPAWFDALNPLKR